MNYLFYYAKITILIEVLRLDFQLDFRTQNSYKLFHFACMWPLEVTENFSLLFSPFLPTEMYSKLCCCAANVEKWQHTFDGKYAFAFRRGKELMQFDPVKIDGGDLTELKHQRSRHKTRKYFTERKNDAPTAL